MNIKNNSALLGSIIVVIFGVIVYVVESNRRKDLRGIKRNRRTETGISVGCRKNFRSSLYNLDYKFVYKGVLYYGTEKFDIGKRGYICKGYNFVVEFDSLVPDNNKIMLDSIIIN